MSNVMILAQDGVVAILEAFMQSSQCDYRMPDGRLLMSR